MERNHQKLCFYDVFRFLCAMSPSKSVSFHYPLRSGLESDEKIEDDSEDDPGELTVKGTVIYTNKYRP